MAQMQKGNKSEAKQNLQVALKAEKVTPNDEQKIKDLLVQVGK
jgi:hypothetical protein